MISIEQLEKLLLVVKTATDLAYYCVDIQAAGLIKEPNGLNELTHKTIEAILALNIQG